jgi:hypothetical protein
MFGDVRGHRRQFGHLMPTRLTHGVSGVQRARTKTALGRHMIHDLVHSLRRDERADVAGMPRLAAGSTTTLDAAAAHSLVSREPVRGWRLRGRGGVLRPKCQLVFQIRDVFRLLGDLLGLLGVLLTEPLILLAQSFDLMRLATRLGQAARWLRGVPASLSHATFMTDS